MADVFGNIFDKVYSIIKGWKLQKEYTNEDGYRGELIQFLRNEFDKPDWMGTSRQHSIQKESGRHLADIGIDRRVGVELKFNLKGKAQADRLVGQVTGFLKDYHEGVIVVLCGKTDADKVHYLRDSLRENLGRPSAQFALFGQKRVELIVKTSSPQKQPASIF